MNRLLPSAVQVPFPSIASRFGNLTSRTTTGSNIGSGIASASTAASNSGARRGGGSAGSDSGSSSSSNIGGSSSMRSAAMIHSGSNVINGEYEIYSHSSSSAAAANQC